MEAKTELEKKELVKLESRLMTLVNAVTSYKDNPKALKLVSKLIKIEAKSISDCKAPVPAGDLQAIAWRYDDLVDIVKRLTKTKDVTVYSRAASELDALIAKTEDEISELSYVPEDSESEEKATVGEKAKEIVHKVGDGVQKLGEKAKAGVKKIGSTVGEAVGSTIETLKNAFTGDDD